MTGGHEWLGCVTAPLLDASALLRRPAATHPRIDNATLPNPPIPHQITPNPSAAPLPRRPISGLPDLKNHRR